MNDLRGRLLKLKSVYASDGIRDPLPVFKQASKKVSLAVRHSLEHYGVSWAELVDSVRARHPELADRTDMLFQAVNTDIYGRYCDHSITPADLTEFTAVVEEWKSSIMTLLYVYDRMARDSSEIPF
jgi:hypothetical protein